MNDKDSFKRKTSKVGNDVSVNHDDATPVLGVEASISSARPNTESYPEVTNDRPPEVSRNISQEEKDVLGLLCATRRVDVRWLSEEQKARISKVIDDMHNTRMLSLLEISKVVGRSYTQIWGLCRALHIRTRNVAEAQRICAVKTSKHPRRPSWQTGQDQS